MSGSTITTIGFDADDTLWDHERFYQETERDVARLMSDFIGEDKYCERLLETERNNIRRYGFGVKGFTLSMIETAIAVSGGEVDAATISSIIAAGQKMLAHPIELLPGVEDVLASLSEDYRLLLITKGDLFDQERKLEESGLADHFHTVHIVSDKNAATYQRIFDRDGQGPRRSLMIGNSLKSDVLPAVEAGAWGIHIPHELEWSLDRAEMPEKMDRLRVAGSASEITDIIQQMN